MCLTWVSGERTGCTLTHLSAVDPVLPPVPCRQLFCDDQNAELAGLQPCHARRGIPTAVARGSRGNPTAARPLQRPREPRPGPHLCTSGCPAPSQPTAHTPATLLLRLPCQPQQQHLGSMGPRNQRHLPTLQLIPSWPTRPPPRASTRRPRAHPQPPNQQRHSRQLPQ